MEKRFLKLSEIRAKANERALLEYKQSHSAKIVKQIVGVNVLDRAWIDEANRKYQIAKKRTDLTRFDYLKETLDILYYCQWILARNSTVDDEVNKLLHKVETSYLNNCLSFIEQNIHNTATIVNCFTDCSTAIEILGESNAKMADKYRQMLSKFKSLNSSYIKIADLCSASSFTHLQATQIASLLAHHEATLRMYPTLRDAIIELVTQKLDKIFAVTEKALEQELSGSSPSLQQILSLLQAFIDVYQPLITVVPKKRYDTIREKSLYYQHIMQVITDEYPVWSQSYQYYSLPRNHIDENKLTSISKAIAKHQNIFEQNFVELRSLSPSVTDIQNLMLSLLDAQSQGFIIEYLRKENEILSLPEGDVRVVEVVRFIHHIRTKLAENTTDTRFRSELQRLHRDFLQVFHKSTEKKLREFIATSPTQLVCVNFFDKVTAIVFELNDLAVINHWKNVLKALGWGLYELDAEVAKCQKDYEYLQSLPESEAKETFFSRLCSDVKNIKDNIPIMLCYQVPNVEKNIAILVELEKKLTTKSNPSLSTDRLLILDKFTSKNIVVFAKDMLNIGRDETTNDIILKSDWVSNSHCQLKIRGKLLVDTDSTNGTRVNNQKERISEVKLDTVEKILLADIFEMSIEGFTGFYILKIVKVHDKELLNRESEYIRSLFNTEFIWLVKYHSFSIDTLTSKVKIPDKNSKNEIIITHDGAFTIIDTENSQSATAIKPDEEIYTDRYTICLR